MTMELQWHTTPFDAFSLRDLHDALQLRSAVFVVEQNCVYPDVDGHDLTAWHVLARDRSGALVAYARILPGEPPHIGRVVVAPAHRRKGIATELMWRAMVATEQFTGSRTIALAAQAHLEAFYAGLGFRRVGPTYDLDGIPHVDMVRKG